MCINAKTRPKDNTHELNMRYDIPPPQTNTGTSICLVVYMLKY